MMALLVITVLLLGFCFTYGYGGDEPSPLKWPTKYTVEARKISLDAGLIEDFKYWHSASKSRVDRNNGADTVISRGPKLKSKNKWGIKYQLHPETTEEYTNKIICYKTTGSMSNPILAKNHLPKESLYEYIGTDILQLGNVSKFEYKDDDLQDATLTKTLWAKYDEVNGTKTWIPVRLQELGYDTVLFRRNKYVIWEFFNFNTNFSSSVFDIETSHNCTEKEDEDDDALRYPKVADPENENHVDLNFKMFKQIFNVNYKDEQEHELRKKIFQNNLRLITAHNKMNSSFTLSINKFSDKTPAEMKKRTGLIRKTPREPGNIPFPYTQKKLAQISSNLPKNFDLRMLGYVTPARDQGECGSCWTFGSTSATEGALARSNGGRLIRLSNQALVDCAWGFGASGCEGGSDTAAYRWMIEHGLPTEEEYGPYKNQNGFCNIQNMTTKYPIRGFTDVTPYSVEALKVALVNHGPLSVSMHKTGLLDSYSGGIFYDILCSPEILNHEVTLVGYGEKDGEEYWIVKNSWGKDWGIDGYFYISTRDNNCNIATEPTYVVF